MFTIEKNIPLTKTSSYPFEKMESGDCFFIPVTDQKTINQIRGQIQSAKSKYPGKIIATRRDTTGLRVWMLNKGTE